MSTTLHTLRVFLGPGGSGGNPLGVFLDGAAIPAHERQAVAADLGFSETVFVDDAAAGALRIFTPTDELDLAGHPLVGTSWLLTRTGVAATVLRPPAGAVPTWTEDDVVWIRARAEWAPQYVLEQLDGPDAVTAHPGAEPGAMLAVWAWQDEAAGRIRVRVFPRAIGIAEDEATGGAALQFGAALARPLEISQGVGSRLLVRPGDDGTVAVGGAVELVSETSYPG